MLRNKALILLIIALFLSLLATGWSLPAPTVRAAAIKQKALQNLNTDNGAGLAPASSVVQSALMDLYTSTNGPSWNFNSGWGTVASYCSWYGVICVNGTIAGLYLSQNGLSGTIPPSIGDLTSLVLLDLSLNQLTGAIPSTIGNLVALQTLALYVNPLNGTLPASIGSLTALVDLFIYETQISGTVPATIGQLANVVNFYLYANRLNGSLPVFPATMTKLSVVYMNDNAFSGAFPDFSAVPTLTEIWINKNQLTGPFPLSLTSLQSLTVLVMFGNQFTGTIPPAISNMINLQILDLSNNLFEGPLQAAVLTYPVVFSAANNMLSGPLPAFVSTTIMYSLDLSNNNFSGPIPEAYNRVLAQLDVTGNPYLRQSCGSGIDTVLCGPAFLAVDSTLQATNVSTHVTCSTIVTNSLAPTLVVSVDPSYTNYGLCQCSVGFFEVRPRAVGAPPVCVSCSTVSTEQCTCDNGLLRGCYPTPFAGPWVSSVACPIVGLNVTACNPSDVLPAPITNTSTFLVSNVFRCAPGYTDRLCSRCEEGSTTDEGYYRSSRECAPCRPYMPYTLPILYAVLLVLATLVVLKLPAGSVGVLRITLLYEQSLLVLAESNAVKLDTGFTRLLTRSASAFSFSAVGAVDCIFGGLSDLQRTAIYALSPAIVLVYAVIVFVVGKVVERLRGEPIANWRDRCIYLALFLITSAYYLVTSQGASAVGCTVQDPVSSDLYVNMYPYLRCSFDVPQFCSMAAWGIFTLIVWTLGIPVLVVVLLLRLRRAQAETRVRQVVGFLADCYRPETEWWEAVLMLRRFLLAFAPAMIPFYRPDILISVLLLVWQLSLLGQHLFAPFRSRLENALELATLYVTIVSFIFALIVQRSDVESFVSGASIFIISINATLTFVLVVVIVLVYAATAAGRLAQMLNLGEVAKGRLLTMHTAISKTLFRDTHDVPLRTLSSGTGGLSQSDSDSAYGAGDALRTSLLPR